jgi:hypothetical protein
LFLPCEASSKLFCVWLLCKWLILFYLGIPGEDSFMDANLATGKLLKTQHIVKLSGTK